MKAVLFLAASPIIMGLVQGQATCTLDGFNVDCTNLALTALPTVEQWNSFTDITLGLRLMNGNIAKIPDNGFDTCPYTAASFLYLRNNTITTVGARAFANLPKLTFIDLQINAITWMAPTSFDGLSMLYQLALVQNQITTIRSSAFATVPTLGILRLNQNAITWLSPAAFGGLTKLELLYLHMNNFENFDYGALARMDALTGLTLYESAGDCGNRSCDGVCSYTDAANISAAVASCGRDENLCPDCAVGCPNNAAAAGRPCVLPSFGEIVPCPAGMVREYDFGGSNWHTLCRHAGTSCAAATETFGCCSSAGVCYECPHDGTLTDCFAPPLPSERTFPAYKAADGNRGNNAGLDGAAIGAIVAGSVSAVALAALCYVQRQRLYTRLEI